MARNFVRSGSNQWLGVNAPDISDQITISAWVKQTTAQSGNFPNGYQILIRQNTGITTNINYALFIRNGLTFEWTTGTNVFRAVTLSLTNDTNWHHYCAAVDWINGTYSLAKDGNVTIGTFTPSTPETSSGYVTYIGRQGSSGGNGEFMNGDIADVAIWNTKIFDDEIKSLAKGFDALRVKPQSLVRYWPLVRELQEVKTGSSITNNNTTVANHPRVYA
jgi:hypothetical protein